MQVPSPASFVPVGQLTGAVDGVETAAGSIIVVPDFGTTGAEFVVCEPVALSPYDVAEPAALSL